VRGGGFFGPGGLEVNQQLTRLVVAEKEAGEKAVFQGQRLHRMPQAIKAIDQGAQRFAVAGAHLFIQPEIVFEPDMQGQVTFIGLYDLDGVAELVVEDHELVSGLGCSASASFSRMRARAVSARGRCE